MMNLLRDLHKELGASQSGAGKEAPPSAPQSKLPIDPSRLEELVAARLSKWVYCSDGISEPIPDLPGVSLSAGCVSEELQTGSVKMALVTAELPGDHKTLFVVFKGTSYLLDVVNWNMEHDYEVIGDGNNFMHKGLQRWSSQLCAGWALAWRDVRHGCNVLCIPRPAEFTSGEIFVAWRCTKIAALNPLRHVWISNVLWAGFAANR
eukprot:symbB.v1.2.016473.t1/scaffold1252.1/size200744/21